MVFHSAESVAKSVLLSLTATVVCLAIKPPQPKATEEFRKKLDTRKMPTGCRQKPCLPIKATVFKVDVYRTVSLFVSCSNHNHGPSCAGITQLMRPGGNAFPHWPLLWHSRSSEVITSPLRPQHAGTVPTKTPFFRHQLRGTSLFFIRAPGIHEVKFAHPSLVSLIYLPHRCLRCHYHPRSMQTWWYRCSISSTRSYIRRPLRVALWTVWCSPVVQGAVILLIANFELLLVVAAASGGCVLVTGGVAWNFIWPLRSRGTYTGISWVVRIMLFLTQPRLAVAEGQDV